jgi:hypothetical protein
MSSADRNDFVPAQEKQEWVTPKILQMTVEETFGSGKAKAVGEEGLPLTKFAIGPS